MSTYAIIFWTVVVTAAVVLWLVKLGEKSSNRNSATEWERYEEERERVDALDRRIRRDALNLAEKQHRMKVVAARLSDTQVILTIEDGTEHLINVGSEFPFYEGQFVGDTLKQARQSYPD